MVNEGEVGKWGKRMENFLWRHKGRPASAGAMGGKCNRIYDVLFLCHLAVEGLKRYQLREAITV